jgi:hypothetical protein
MNGQCVSQSSRISSAVPLLRPADPHQVTRNIPCLDVPLIHISQTVIPAHLAGQARVNLLPVVSSTLRREWDVLRGEVGVEGKRVGMSRSDDKGGADLGGCEKYETERVV